MASHDSRTSRSLRLLSLGRLLAVSVALLSPALSAKGQISFTSAIDLSLRNSPRVKVAEDDVRKAQAVLLETKSVFIPSIVAGGGAGASSGITLNVPTIFTINAQSLVFNSSQRDYIRAARSGLEAATLALTNVREQIAEDAAVSYLSLDRTQKREGAMADEYRFAVRLVAIVQERFDAGLDTDRELKKARRTLVQIRLLQLQLEDEKASLRDHLARLTGLPGSNLETVPESVPSSAAFRAPEKASADAYRDTPEVLSAQANARAKWQTAFGDSRYTWRPQITFDAQYGRISPINNVSTYYNLNGNYNTLAAGIQIQLPFLDRTRRAKGREAMADAQHAAHELDFLRDQQGESRLKVSHNVAELEAKVELAELDAGIAQDDLNAMSVQVKADGGNSAPPMTPKDEQNVHIQERQRFIDSLDAKLQLQEAEISLLRQTTGLNEWLRSLVVTTVAPVPR
ncbi:TolC family protein [Terriglobus saanensis]|uniref:Outer membrane efflux protein n=1 Tax=Terriglobus saanensis (strain ATCC BAA-1853 / DSM 23119 / SP1PR4) TaxID=401053 RepID=E8V0Q5_TERSS|nr:TolC family protein [Terriglobus saanensis]ADV81118.1 outer membrane efflux protein [Terriglobus saanensis SP1PR4]